MGNLLWIDFLEIALAQKKTELAAKPKKNQLAQHKITTVQKSKELETAAKTKTSRNIKKELSKLRVFSFFQTKKRLK